MKERGKFLDFNMGPPPYPLEFILRDATGPDGQFIGNVGHPTSVMVDYPFITGRSTPDSYLTGQKLVEVLDGGKALVYWFTYHSDGRQRWLIGLGRTEGNRIVVNELLDTHGGR